MSDEPKSKFATLRVPEFRQTIPEHFLVRLADQERYIVQALSKMEQESVWVTNALVEANAQRIDLDSRLNKVETWKDRLTSKWTVVAAIAVLIIPVLLKALIEHWLHP
jgi:hypothetical protein